MKRKLMKRGGGGKKEKKKKQEIDLVSVLKMRICTF